MKLLILALFVAALCVHAWDRLAATSRAAIRVKAKAMIDRASQFIRNKIMRRRMSYKHLFLGDRGDLSPAGRVVLADLAKFCRGFTSTTVVGQSGAVDTHASFLAEGRREVFLRILKELNLDPSEAISAMKDEDALAA